MIKITENWLKKNYACLHGVLWRREINTTDAKVILKAAIKDQSEEHFGYCIWMLNKILTKKQSIKYAIYCSKLMLPIFESKYPNDKRPINAIKAARAYLKTINKTNDIMRALAADAAYDAYTVYAAHPAFTGAGVVHAAYDGVAGFVCTACDGVGAGAACVAEAKMLKYAIKIIKEGEKKKCLKKKKII